MVREVRPRKSSKNRGMPYTGVIERPDLQEILLGNLDENVVQNGVGVHSYTTGAVGSRITGPSTSSSKMIMLWRRRPRRRGRHLVASPGGDARRAGARRRFGCRLFGLHGLCGRVGLRFAGQRRGRLQGLHRAEPVLCDHGMIAASLFDASRRWRRVASRRASSEGRRRRPGVNHMSGARSSRRWRGPGHAHRRCRRDASIERAERDNDGPRSTHAGHRQGPLPVLRVSRAGRSGEVRRRKRSPMVRSRSSRRLLRAGRRTSTPFLTRRAKMKSNRGIYMIGRRLP